MKFLIPSITVAALTALSACQSNNNRSEDVQQQTAQHATEQQAVASRQPSAPMAKEAAQKLPEFKFYKVKSGIGFTNDDIASGRKTVFILFDPNCGHCQTETGLIAKNYEQLKDINLYFISMNDPALMASFLETFGKELVDKPNVEVLYDRNQDFIQKFHVPDQFPANYVYTADGLLQTYWEGDKKIDDIIAAYKK